MEDADLLETRLDRKVVYSGGYMTLHVDTIEDALGRRHQREVIEHPGAVAIVALDGPELLLVRQYRTAATRLLLEIPAGTLDRLADGSKEAPEAAAPRELAEETGFRAATWRRLGHFFTAPGFADEDMHVFVATDLTPVPGYTGPETDERIRLIRIPWLEAVELALSGGLEDAKSMLAILWVDALVRSGEIVLPG